MRNLLGFVCFAFIIFGHMACDSTTSAPAPAASGSAPATANSSFPKAEAEKLIQRLVLQDGCKDSNAEMRLSFTDADGKPQQMDFRLQRKYEAGKVATLMTVISPAEESEKALLAFEEDGKPTSAISYLAGLKKVAQLKSDNPLNFRGSKSTVQEMLGMELGKYDLKSTTTKLETGLTTLTIELTEKKGMNLAFPKLIVHFSKPEKVPANGVSANEKTKNVEPQFFPESFELYDAKDALVKRMEFTQIDFVEVGADRKYNTIKVISITDERSGQKLKLETRNIKYDTNLAASIFTEANLIKNVTAASQKQIQ